MDSRDAARYNALTTSVTGPGVARPIDGAMRYAVLILSALLLAGTPAPPAPKVVIVPIVGEIGHRNNALLRRAIAQIRRENPALVIFEIDTPGGRVDHTLDMGEQIQGLAPIPTVAFVRPLDAGGSLGAAWSAGVYLAISCTRIYMYPGTVIGAATPVQVGPEGVEAVSEKQLSALRQKFRARAEQNGYPANLVVAMVDKDLELYEVVLDGRRHYLTLGEIDDLKEQGKTFDWPSVPFDSKDKLVTLTAGQVVRSGMGRTASSREEIYRDFGLSSPVEIVIESSWSEDLVGFLTSQVVSTILLIVGILGLWVEFKTPGFGLAGIAGILALALLLFGHHLAGLAEWGEILLIAAGLVLVLAELLLLPGVGVLAIAGVICVFVGLVLSFQDFALPDPAAAPWQMDLFLSSVGRVIFGFAGATAAFLAVLRFLPRVPVLNALVLEARIDGTAPAAAGASDLVGRRGHALTPLRPGGKVQVDGQTLDVVAEGEFVAPGEPVEVVRVEGVRVVVGKTKR